MASPARFLAAKRLDKQLIAASNRFIQPRSFAWEGIDRGIGPFLGHTALRIHEPPALSLYGI